MKIVIISLLALVVLALGAFFFFQADGARSESLNKNPMTNQHINDASTTDMIVAGGCFWCVEADMEKVPGVVEVISGYSGGDTENPTYENYARGGHREVAKVIYNPEEVDYGTLLEYFMKHIDPTDGEGSFGDRGAQYSPAIYYTSDEEKATAEKVVQNIEESGVFEENLQVPVLPQETFWRAEEYHQDYYKKHSLKYGFYRKASGRDSFIKKHWGDEADNLLKEK